MELVAEATRVSHLVLGIGVNLNTERAQLPDEFRHMATSLASHCGRRVDRVAFARRLFENLERTLDACAENGFAGILPRFQTHFRMPGCSVRVRELDGTEIAGVVLGIDTDGALIVAPPDSDEVRVVAGDVTIDKEEP
jgi:BirA family biotin operon repressor/biotin-[acetyl-CoA-carboxylase] ligase